MIVKQKCMLLFLITACLLTGCNAEETKETEKETGNLTTQIELEEEMLEHSEEYIVVGFSQVGSESDWRIASTESVQKTFSSENGYYLIFEDGQQKQENQIKAIRNFILQEVDYIILDPIVETGWDAVFNEAKEAGIPIILADRSVVVEDESLYTCWVGSDFTAEGRRAGEWLENYLEKQGRTEEQIHIVTLQGTVGSTAQIGRCEGFHEVLERNSNWIMLEKRTADFVQAKGQEVMEYFLDTYEDIDVIISQNDNMTFGVMEALDNVGKTYGPDGDIIVISFDAVKAALEAMQEGSINAEFECNPELAPLIAKTIQKLEKGEPVEKIQYIEEAYFDSTMNLEEILETRTY